MSDCQCRCHTSKENFSRYISFIGENCCKCESLEKPEAISESLEQRIAKLEAHISDVLLDFEAKIKKLEELFNCRVVEMQEHIGNHIKQIRDIEEQVKSLTERVIDKHPHPLLGYLEKFVGLQDHTVLSKKDSEIVMENLKNPAEPNQALKDLMKSNKKCDHSLVDGQYNSTCSTCSKRYASILMQSNFPESEGVKGTVNSPIIVAFDFKGQYINKNGKYFYVTSDDEREATKEEIDKLQSKHLESDTFKKKKIKTYWANVYRYGNGDLRMGYVWKSIEAAQQCDEMGDSFLKTISFEIEEDE